MTRNRPTSDDYGERSPSTERVDVSVLIPVRNEAAHIRETVEAMLAQQFEGNVEYLFIEGRSSDRTCAILQEIAQRDSRVRVLDNPHRRTAAALNIGLAHARGEFVARMDAHAIYESDYLALGVERVRRGDVHWVAGPAVPYGVDRWSRRVALALETGLGTVGSRKWGGSEAPPAERELDTGVWAGVWRRETLERHGGWDAAWPVNQDSELAARFLEAGERIVLVPGMAARYIPRASLKRLTVQYARYGYYRAKTACRHPHSARASHAMAPGVAFSLVAAVPRRGRPARLLLLTYFGALVAAAARAARVADKRDAASLPLVSATMHLAWGYGYLYGSLRNGPPFAAIAHVSGLRRRTRDRSTP